MEPIFYLFADDTNILSSYKNLQPLVHAVSVELKKLYTWLTLNTEVKPACRKNLMIWSYLVLTKISHPFNLKKENLAIRKM